MNKQNTNKEIVYIEIDKKHWIIDLLSKKDLEVNSYVLKEIINEEDKKDE